MTSDAAAAGQGPVVADLQDIVVTYDTAAGPVEALRGVDLQIRKGSATAIVGRSGSGKSSLVSVLSLLRLPTTGQVLISGVDVATASERRRARLRASKIGVVFQAFHLEPSLSVLDNVMLPWVISGRDGSRREVRSRAGLLLEQLGIADLAGRRPTQLSGGQRQRVAVARALQPGPQLLVADEPTGNLDEDSAEQVVSLILGAAATQGAAVVLVTHDATIAGQADRTVELARGRIADDSHQQAGVDA